jgi:cbb3-type cytochrome oxidase subunit 1
MLRAALIWFGIGATMGGLMLAHKGVLFAPQVWSFYATHVHMMLVGWTAQFAMGVAFWILPRLDAGGSRGAVRMAEMSFGCINAGMLVMLVSGLAGALGASSTSWPNGLAGLLYAVAALAFAVHAWPRVRPMLAA